MSPAKKPPAPEWATHTEQRDNRVWHTKEVGQVDLADGASAIVVRIALIVWLPTKPLGAPQPVPTTSVPFVDVRRVSDGKPSDNIGALSAQAATELAGLLLEAVRLAKYFGGAR